MKKDADLNGVENQAPSRIGGVVLPPNRSFKDNGSVLFLQRSPLCLLDLRLTAPSRQGIITHLWQK
jgi:hypothetical protein